LLPGEVLMQKTFMKKCRAAFLYRLGRSLRHDNVRHVDNPGQKSTAFRNLKRRLCPSAVVLRG
jgi:hypothetical protein